MFQRRVILNVLNGKFSAGLLGATIGVSAIYSYSTAFDKTITIDEKFTRVEGDEHGTSQVFSFSDTNGDVYKVVNSLWYWKWYSVETWARLKEGHTYEVSGYGFRFGPLGFYPNILSVKEIAEIK